MKIVMNKATCIKHNCVLCSTNYGVENFMSDSLKKNTKNLPTNPLLKMGVGVHQKCCLLMTSVHTVDNIVSLN